MIHHKKHRQRWIYYKFNAIIYKFSSFQVNFAAFLWKNVDVPRILESIHVIISLNMT